MRKTGATSAISGITSLTLLGWSLAPCRNRRLKIGNRLRSITVPSIILQTLRAGVEMADANTQARVADARCRTRGGITDRSFGGNPARRCRRERRSLAAISQPSEIIEIPVSAPRGIALLLKSAHCRDLTFGSPFHIQSSCLCIDKSDLPSKNRRQ
jgi:hypothetical protein